MYRLFFCFLLISFSLCSSSCNKDDDKVTVTITADFTANQFAVEEGGSIGFTDLSTGDPTSWTWTFEGGEPASSTEQNPTVTYTVAGTYEVSLTVSNGSTEGTETKAGYITVTEKAAPFQELYDQGIDRYLGVFTPTTQIPLGGAQGLAPDAGVAAGDRPAGAGAAHALERGGGRPARLQVDARLHRLLPGPVGELFYNGHCTSGGDLTGKH